MGHIYTNVRERKRKTHDTQNDIHGTLGDSHETQ